MNHFMMGPDKTIPGQPLFQAFQLSSARNTHDLYIHVHACATHMNIIYVHVYIYMYMYIILQISTMGYMYVYTVCDFTISFCGIHVISTSTFPRKNAESKTYSCQ